MSRVTFKLPDIGEGVAEGEIIRWLVKEGDEVRQFQPIVEVLTAKAKVEIPSPYDGRIVKILAKEGDVVPVGSPLVEIEVAGKPVDGEEVAVEAGGETGETTTQEQPVEVEMPREETRVRAPPGVRLLAKRLGVDLSRVRPTGPRGIVTRRDVEAAAREEVVKPVEAVAKPTEQVEKPVERIRIHGIRRFMYTTMTKAKQTIPHAYLIEEVDVTRLWELRERLKGYAAEKGVKLTITPFIVKAVTMALKEYPLLNASIDEERMEIIVKKYYNIGIAVDSPEGLVVPNIKDADKKSILELAREIRMLADKARKMELSLEEVQDGTFSITNIGAIGSIAGMAVINPPEVAILGVHRTFERPALVDGQLVNRKYMYISISFDHRILEGAYVTRFLMRLKEILENPELLLLE